MGVRIFDLAQNAVRRPLTILRRSSPALESDAGLIRFEYQTGRLIGLWRCRKDYKSNLRMIEQPRWRNSAGRHAPDSERHGIGKQFA